MRLLYITADRIGTPTGGGAVTYHESEALKELGECQVLGCDKLESVPTMRFAENGEPWKWDTLASFYLTGGLWNEPPRLAHFYAGTFTETVRHLKRNGCKVAYTCAAHSVAESRKEHESLGIPYAELYPHLCDPEQWRRYSGGYFAADVLVVPSTHSERVVREQATALGVPCPRVEVIPHGCTLPEKVAPLPRRFTVGYMGAYGPDKGVAYLLRAWKRLAYRDATLVLAGRDSTSSWVRELVAREGGGNVRLLGWVKDISEFYNQISLYVQPSVSEGFGIEVLEAMAHSRPVVCSTGAGAVDVLPDNPFAPSGKSWAFEPRDVERLVSIIHDIRMLREQDNDDIPNPMWREIAERYTWDKIRAKYRVLWRELL